MDFHEEVSIPVQAKRMYQNNWVPKAHQCCITLQEAHVHDTENKS